MPGYSNKSKSKSNRPAKKGSAKVKASNPVGAKKGGRKVAKKR